MGMSQKRIVGGNCDTPGCGVYCAKSIDWSEEMNIKWYNEIAKGIRVFFICLQSAAVYLNTYSLSKNWQK